MYIGLFVPEAVPALGHEEAVSNSLDSALHQTLQGLQMFTRKKTDVEEKPTLTQASITQSESGQYLFSRLSGYLVLIRLWNNGH